MLTVPLCVDAPPCPYVTIGLVDEKSVRAMREPVTTISPISVASSSAGGAVCPRAVALAVAANSQVILEATGFLLLITSPPD